MNLSSSTFLLSYLGTEGPQVRSADNTAVRGWDISRRPLTTEAKTADKNFENALAFLASPAMQLISLGGGVGLGVVLSKSEKGRKILLFTAMIANIAKAAFDVVATLKQIDIKEWYASLPYDQANYPQKQIVRELLFWWPIIEEIWESLDNVLFGAVLGSQLPGLLGRGETEVGWD